MMHNAHITHELDQLIASYNWESLEPDRRNQPSEIRNILLGKAHTSIWRRFNHPDATQVIIRLLLHILDHPEWQLKEMIFEQFSLLHIFLKRGWGQRRQRELQKLRHLLQQCLPRFKGYLTHRNADYRVYAALSLASYTHRSHEVIECLLVQLQREHSPRVIYHILYALLLIASFRRRMVISLEDRHTILQRVAPLLSARHPWVRHAAATLMMRIMGQKTPEFIVEVMVSTWPHLRNTKWHQYETIDEAFTGHINGLGMERAFDVYLRLMRVSTTYRGVSIVWDSFFYSSLRKWLGWQDVSGKRIALTPKQKVLMEAIAGCRIFWQWRRGAPDKLKMQGLELTRAGFREQIKHARIVDQLEKGPHWRRFPLQVKRELK